MNHIIFAIITFSAKVGERKEESLLGCNFEVIQESSNQHPLP